MGGSAPCLYSHTCPRWQCSAVPQQHTLLSISLLSLSSLPPSPPLPRSCLPSSLVCLWTSPSPLRGRSLVCPFPGDRSQPQPFPTTQCRRAQGCWRQSPLTVWGNIESAPLRDPRVLQETQALSWLGAPKVHRAGSHRAPWLHTALEGQRHRQGGGSIPWPVPHGLQTAGGWPPACLLSPVSLSHPGTVAASGGP